MIQSHTDTKPNQVQTTMTTLGRHSALYLQHTALEDPDSEDPYSEEDDITEESVLRYLANMNKHPIVLEEGPVIPGFTHLMIAAATQDAETTKSVLDCLPEEVHPIYMFLPTSQSMCLVEEEKRRMPLQSRQHDEITSSRLRSPGPQNIATRGGQETAF
jgi:hypothetical protein